MTHHARTKRTEDVADAVVSVAPSYDERNSSDEPLIPTEPDRQRDLLLTAMLQTGMRLQAAVNKRFLKHGLTMLDASVVLLCVKAPLGVTPGKLAVILARDKGKITHVVDRLQTNGFVTRTGGRHDRRISLIRPTRKAKKIAPVLGTLLIGVRRQLFAEVAESDLKYLTNSLVRLRENVKSVAYACDGHEYEKPKRRQP